MNFLFLNVQSPPIQRAERIISRLSDEDFDICVLSELSSGEGSLRVAQQLEKAGFHIIWNRPEAREYAVLLVIKASLNARSLNWKAEWGRNRAQFAQIKIKKHYLIVGGMYAPALNFKNTSYRRLYFERVEGLLQHAGASPGRITIVGGDVNEIPPWGEPQLENYVREGFPWHRVLAKSNLADIPKIWVDPKTHTWYSPIDGKGQLLDGAYITRGYESLVSKYEVDHSYRIEKFTDHSAIRMSILLDW